MIFSSNNNETTRYNCEVAENRTKKLKINRIYFYLFFFIVLGCKENTHKFKLKNSNNYDCISKVLNIGDTTCYNMLILERDYDKDLLFFSILMANKYKYEKANLDVFKIMLKNYAFWDLNNFSRIDSLSQNFMMKYLIRAKKENETVVDNIIKKIDENLSLNKQMFKIKPDSLLSDEDMVFYFGDTNSYNKLRFSYYDYQSQYFLFWSLFMANKYDYDKAYYDVYNSIFYADIGGDFKELDKETKDMALQYLKIATDRGVNDEYSP